MIAVDTNLLVYAHREDSAFHAAALESLTGLAGSGRRWGIPWPCVHEFISITTHPRIYDPPTPLKVALAAMQVWLEAPGCELLAEGPGYWETLKSLSLKAKLQGPMVHDARIAALCLHHGVTELWSADRDFSRFPAVKTRNPL
ncbi:MAG: type II toxin-antitoxin system VapC family toxin [Oceanipulchritudo sp.]